MKDFFRAVAVIFHPLFMPMFGALITLYFVSYIHFSIDPRIKNFLIIVLAVNVVAPAISLGTMVSRKIISNIQVTDKKERYIPFTLMLFYYGITYLLLRYKLGDGYIPNDIYSMLLGILVSLVLALVISFRFKISIHTLGASGVLGAVSAFAHMYQFNSEFGGFFWVTVLALVLGLVGTSRLYTEHHKLNEVLLGAAVGFSVNYGIVLCEIVI